MDKEDKHLSNSERELVKLLKKLDPWNSGFWKIHLEEVKEECFLKGMDFAMPILPKKNKPNKN